jgi:hypothetical protein
MSARTLLVQGVVAMLVAVSNVRAQQASRPGALMTAALDSERIELLHREGTSIQSGQATLWYPTNSISAADARALVRMLDSTVRSIEHFLGSPVAGQRYRDPSVTYYIVPAPTFIAYTAAGPMVFMPLDRVRSNAAPWTHETVHAVLWPAKLPPRFIADTMERRRARESQPTWLIEGVPEFVAKTLAPHLGLPDYDTQASGGLAGVDSTCAAQTRRPDAGRFLPWVGLPQMPPNYMQDRLGVARPFYQCSFSLTKYLVTRYGLESVVRLMFSDEPLADMAKLTGHSANDVRRDWLRTIHASSAPVPDGRMRVQ